MQIIQNSNDSVRQRFSNETQRHSKGNNLRSLKKYEAKSQDMEGNL